MTEKIDLKVAENFEDGTFEKIRIETTATRNDAAERGGKKT